MCQFEGQVRQFCIAYFVMLLISLSKSLSFFLFVCSMVLLLCPFTCSQRMVLRQKEEAKAVAAKAKADHAAALAAAAARDEERKEEEKAAAEREKYNKLSPAAKMVHDAQKALEDEKRQAKMNKRQSSSTEPSSPQSPLQVRFCCLSILSHAVPRLTKY